MHYCKEWRKEDYKCTCYVYIYTLLEYFNEVCPFCDFIGETKQLTTIAKEPVSNILTPSMATCNSETTNAFSKFDIPLVLWLFGILTHAKRNGRINSGLVITKCHHRIQPKGVRRND